MASHDTAPVIAAFNVVLSKHALKNEGINVGRNRYFFPQRPTEPPLRLDSVLVALRGLQNIVISTGWCNEVTSLITYRLLSFRATNLQTTFNEYQRNFMLTLNNLSHYLDQ
jgi:hypothetical protein